MANKACHHRLKDFVAQTTLLVACHALATSSQPKRISINLYSVKIKSITNFKQQVWREVLGCGRDQVPHSLWHRCQICDWWLGQADYNRHILKYFADVSSVSVGPEVRVCECDGAPARVQHGGGSQGRDGLRGAWGDVVNSGVYMLISMTPLIVPTSFQNI